MDSGVFGVDLTNSLDGFDGVAASFFLAGGNGEGESIHDDVIDAHAPLVNQCVHKTTCNTNLVGGGASLTFFIDGESDDGSTVFFHQRHDATKARGGAIAIFEVHRVDDRATTNKFHTCLQHSRLCGVHHEGQCGRTRES